MLPTFFIIGAGKCGTTALHAYLDRHPEIEMTAHKEVHFFLGPGWRQRIAGYDQEFRGGPPQRGDASPGYTVFPRHADTPDRIGEHVPDARLIYLVRDPIDRIVSHWVQRYWGGDRTSLDEWLAAADRPDNLIVCASRYATQVERYLEHFPRERLLVLDQEDLRSDRRATLREVFAFVGVDSEFDSPAFDEQRNTRSEKFAPVGAGARLWDGVIGPEGVVGRAARHLPRGIRTPIASAARRALFRRVEAPPEIDPSLLEQVKPMLAEEADRLRALTGRDFAHWSV